MSATTSAQSKAGKHDEYFNPLDPGVLDDPYPAYAVLRAERPVYWHSAMGLWLVSRYSDCVSVLVDHHCFSSDYRRAGKHEDPALISVQTLDPPEQVPVRRLLLAALKSLDMRSLQVAVRRDAANVISAAAVRGTVDFVSDVAAPFAFAAAVQITGIDLEKDCYMPDAKRISDASVPALRPDLVRPGLDARQRLSDLLERSYAEGPETGVLGYVRNNPATAGIPLDLLLNSFRVILLAIINSGTRFFTLGLRTLLRAPERAAQFASAQSADRAIHELIRIDGPFQAQEKICLADTQIAKTGISRGDRVVVLFGSANHDEDQFQAPTEILFDRHPNPHLGFGRGVHACLGAHVGIVLSRAILGVITQDYPRTHLDGPMVMDTNPTIRGVQSMPVRFS